MKKIIFLSILILSCIFATAGCSKNNEPQVLVNYDTFVYEINRYDAIDKQSITINFRYEIKNGSVYDIVFYLKGYSNDLNEVWNYEYKVDGKKIEDKNYSVSIYQEIDYFTNVFTIEISNIDVTPVNDNAFKWIAEVFSIVAIVLLAGIIIFSVLNINNKRKKNYILQADTSENEENKKQDVESFDKKNNLNDGLPPTVQ